MKGPAKIMRICKPHSDQFIAINDMSTSFSHSEQPHLTMKASDQGNRANFHPPRLVEVEELVLVAEWLGWAG
jgi:hypothetical protein